MSRKTGLVSSSESLYNLSPEVDAAEVLHPIKSLVHGLVCRYISHKAVNHIYAAISMQLTHGNFHPPHVRGEFTRRCSPSGESKKERKKEKRKKEMLPQSERKPVIASAPQPRPLVSVPAYRALPTSIELRQTLLSHTKSERPQ
jgi:hypothetical protein